MLYLLNIQFSKPESGRKSDFYYAILGAFLNLFENQQKVYDSILKLSFDTSNDLTISMCINGEEGYNLIVSHLLSHPEQEISINGNKCKLKQLNFKFELLDINNLEFNNFDKFQLKFYSPTFVRNQNITYMLPNADKFIFSVYEKLNKIHEINIDKKQFKEWIKNNIFVGEFNLSTKLINIKGGKKAGVVGFCTYYIENNEHEEYKKLLYLLLKSIKFFGIGSCTNLGCGNVSCYITSKNKKTS